MSGETASPARGTLGSSTPDEQSLILAAKRGEPGALGEIYDTYRNRVYN